MASKTDNKLARGTWLALIFGGKRQMTWALCAFLMLIPGCGAHNLHYDFFTFLGGTETTRGFVTDVVVERHQGGTRFASYYETYEHHYVYDVWGGSHDGVSHSGSRRDGEVEVEFVTDDPDVSRIVGMSTKSGNGLWAILAFLVFAGCIVWTVRNMKNVDKDANKLINQLVALPQYHSIGRLPKFRLDRNERLIAQQSSPLLVLPVTAALLFVLAIVLMVG